MNEPTAKKKKRTPAEMLVMRDGLLLSGAEPRDYEAAARECDALVKEKRGFLHTRAMELAAAVCRRAANSVAVVFTAPAESPASVPGVADTATEGGA